MYVHSLVLKDVSSFGPTQTLPDLRKFNLLIGKNGSGKTNTIRIIGDLRHELSHVSGQISVQQGAQINRVQAYLVKLQHDLVCDRLSKQIDVGDIQIDYISNWRTGGPETRRRIIFTNGQLVEGNVEELKNQTQIVLPEWDDVAFTSSILRRDTTANSPLIANATLDFALSYIFESLFRVEAPGWINQFHTRQGDSRSGSSGIVRFNKDRWSQGMLRVAKMVQQMQSKSVVLIEEPELHLEPRAIRRFMSFLAWLATPQNEAATADGIVGELEKQWNEFVSESRSFYRIEEGEAFQSQNQNRQFFMTSHSSILIQQFLLMGTQAAVYEFDTEWMDNGFDPNAPGMSGSWTKEDQRKGWVDRKTLFTRIRPIANRHHQVLDNLGCRGSDLLQCNGVVWVEGPSDVIFLKKWLEMFAAEKGLSALIQGQDFEFQMYGGALLDSLCLIKDGSGEEVEKRKLIEMFSFSRNAYLIVDSDAVKKAVPPGDSQSNANSDFIIEDQSTFFRAKQFMRDEIQRLNQNGCRLGLWYAENDTELRTIEDYVDEASIDSVGKSLTKKVRAQRIVDSWRTGKTLDGFRHELRGEIEKLDETIRSWQR